MTQNSTTQPHLLGNRNGIHAEVFPCGTIRALRFRDILLSLWPTMPWEPPIAGVYLRPRLNRAPQSAHLLLGGKPHNQTTCQLGQENNLLVAGTLSNFSYLAEFALLPETNAFAWLVEIRNESQIAREFDLVFLHGIALTDENGVLLNEFYVSHYVDHFPFQTPSGSWAIASRQNLPAGGRNPWCLCSATGNITAFATDALQTHGLWQRSGNPPRFFTRDLPSLRHQGEHSLVALQSAPLRLEPNASTKFGFCLHYRDHHPKPSSPTDFALAQVALAQTYEKLDNLSRYQNLLQIADGNPNPKSLSPFAAPSLAVTSLKKEELKLLFPEPWLHEEKDSEGNVLSFFLPEGQHVVTQLKEREVLRPHGHILRSGDGWEPDESEVAATAWMAGIFLAQFAQGHPSANRLLSTAVSYLGLQPAGGLRIWLEEDGKWQLLGIPSVWEVAPTACRWIYSKEDKEIEIILEAIVGKPRMELRARVRRGSPARFLLAAHLALDDRNGRGTLQPQIHRETNRLAILPHPESFVGRRFPGGKFALEWDVDTTWEAVGGAEVFLGEQFVDAPFVALRSAPVEQWALRICGELLPAQPPPAPRVSFAEATRKLLEIQNGAENPNFAKLRKFETILPWFAHNAGIHYLSPRGLEQYSGGGWGVRDVCQGAFEFLMALGEFEPARGILRRVFRQQNACGDWPQWFMLHERDWWIRPPDSHGDIVYWPLVALGQWLEATGDASILEEVIAFWDSPPKPIWEHVTAAIEHIRNQHFPGSMLPRYGNGDWNDAMQPALPELRERLCSLWTAQLEVHALQCLAKGLLAAGAQNPSLATEELLEWADFLEKEIHNLGIIQGVCAGLLLQDEETGNWTPLLHPADSVTGIHFSLLPLAHGIGWEIFEPEVAREQMHILRNQLKAVDAVRLFDRPLPYRGGKMQMFQRAETAAYFGREIALAYTHAHLRYAEAAAQLGDAAECFHALEQVVPIELVRHVPSARLRQANCYFSSSDALLPDRPTAEKLYERVKQGQVPFDGGWRIYSSGPGIFTAIILQKFFGVTLQKKFLLLHPVLPPEFDGLEVQFHLPGDSFQIHYHLGPMGCGVEKIQIEEKFVPFERIPHRYRAAGARIPRAKLHEGTLHVWSF